MINRILVPLDGSPLAEEALPLAAALAEPLGATLHLLSVVHPDPALFVATGGATPMAVDPGLVEGELDAQTEGMEKYLFTLANPLRAKGLKVECSVVSGVPAPTIADFARAHKIDMIAMSTHGRSGLSRLISGSVAEQVLRDAGLPVLVVRPKSQRA